MCVDSECTPVQTIERELASCKRYLQQAGLIVNFVIIVHALLEAWLAADEKALHAVLRPRGPIQIPTNIESECHPQEIR